MRICRTLLSCLLHRKGYEFRLAVYPPPQVLQTSGAFIIAPLPPMLPEEAQTAGSLCSANITSRLRSYGPLRHPLLFGRLPGVFRLYDLPCSAAFATGGGGLLQLLSASSSPCCRYHPAEVEKSRRPACDSPYCLRLSVAGSASGITHFRGHLCVRLRCGPVTRSHPYDDLVDGLQVIGFPPLCHPSYKASGFCLGGSVSRGTRQPFAGRTTERADFPHSAFLSASPQGL
jgi:hypothetical protein